MKAKFITFVRGLKNGTPPRFQSYLKSLTLLLGLVVSVSVWGETVTYTHDFTTTISNGDNTLSTITWTASGLSNVGSYNSGNYKGVQIGTSSKTGAVTLTSKNNWGAQSSTSYFGYTKVKKVYVWMNAGAAGCITATVTIGGKSATSDGTQVAKNSSASGQRNGTTKVTFTPANDGKTGTIVIAVSKATANQSAGYLCAIQVECEDAPAVTRTVTWKVNNETYTAGNPTTQVNDGVAVTTLPTAPTTDCGGKTFVGWTATADYTHATTAPGDLFSTVADAPTVSGGDVTYYAVFADKEGEEEGTKKITTVEDIVNGSTYYIGSTVSSTDYYLKANNESGAGKRGSTTTRGEGGKFIFTKSGDKWQIKVAGTDYYMVLNNTNASVTYQTTAGDYDITNVTGGNMDLANNSKYLALNSSSTSSFGSYSSKYNHIWLWKAASATYSNYTTTCRSLESISVKTNPTQSFTKGDAFSAAGLVITENYDNGDNVDVKYDDNKSAFAFSGYDMNTTGNQTVTITYKGKTTTYEINVAAPSVCKAPTFSVAAGTYTGAKSVELNCLTDGATIHYTTDGTTPTTLSPSYSTPINVNQDMTIKAFAAKEGLTSSAVVEATYVINYTITFNMKGHGTAPSTITNAKYNQTITAPTEPSATGYTFEGWFKETDCTNAWDFANDKITESITLFAKWTEKKFDVVLLNSGNQVGETLHIQEGATLGTNLPTLTETDACDPHSRTFVGWTSAEAWEGKVASFDYFVTASTVVSGNMTLNAVWAESVVTPSTNYAKITSMAALTDNDYIFAYDYNGGTQVVMKNTDDEGTIDAAALSLSDGKYKDPDAAYIWKIQKVSDNNYTLYNATIGKYISDTENDGLIFSNTPYNFIVTWDASNNCFRFSSSNWPSYYLCGYVNGNTYYFQSSNSGNGAKYHVHLYKNETQQSTTNYLTTCSTDPLIEVSTESLNGFSTIATAGPSAAQSFTVEGYNLTENITVSASTGYEVSTTEASDYTSSLTLTAINGIVAKTPVYVRLAAAEVAVASVEGNISLTSSGVNKSITLSGTVLAKTLQSISVKTAPTKTTYTIGEKFNPEGLVITATYNSGNETVSYADYESEFSFSPALDAELTASDNKVTITWGGKSEDQSITMQCTVAWQVNGQPWTEGAPTILVNVGSKIETMPTAPTSEACNGKTFVGWSATTIDKTDDEPALLTKVADFTALNAHTTYHAVFAKEGEIGDPTLTKLSSTSDLAVGVNIVVVAAGNDFQKLMYQETVSTSYVAYKTVGTGTGEVALTANAIGTDVKNYWTLSAGSTNGTWKLGDATNGYLYNGSSNDLTADKNSNASNWTIAWDNNKKAFSIKNGSRWLACRSDLSGDNQYKWRGGGTSSLSGTGYLDLYKYEEGTTTYVEYSTTCFEPVEEPVFDLAEGTYKTAQEVKLTCATDDSKIYYSINGGDVTEYTAKIQLEERGTYSITAYAKVGEERISDPVTKVYTLNLPFDNIQAMYAANLADNTEEVGLTLTGAYINKVYSAGTTKQIFVQQGNVGAILSMTGTIPEGLADGKALTATIWGTYKINNDRPQLSNFTLVEGYQVAEGTRPTPAVITSLDAEKVSTNLLGLVTMTGIYSISKESNDITMNSQADGLGTNYALYNIFSAVKALPEQSLACDVIGLFNVKDGAYSIMPIVAATDFKLQTPKDATLPNIDIEGGATSENPVLVPANQVVTLTAVDGFDAYYKVNGGTETKFTGAKTVTITEPTSITMRGARDYYTDVTVTYYYGIDEAHTAHVVNKPDVGPYTYSADKASAEAGELVTMTITPSEHWNILSVKAEYNDGEADQSITATSIGDNQYTFEMPDYDVKIKVDRKQDPTYNVTYLKGGKTTEGEDPQNSSQFEGDIVTVATNSWTATGYTFEGWKITYTNNESQEVEITPIEGQFEMPAFDVKITATWKKIASYGWKLVESTNDLTVGDKVVIACNSLEQGFVAGNLKSTYLDTIKVNFSEDKKYVAGTLPSKALILTLGEESGAWTFANDNSQLLGATNEKTLTWDGANATNTWNITFSEEGVMKMANTKADNAYGSMQYNSGSPRFTTYCKDSQNPIQLYKRVELAYIVTYVANGGSNPPADTYADQDGSVTITSLQPTWNNAHLFIGWNTKADGTGEEYVAGQTYTIEDNLKLYAQWKTVTEYSITFVAGEGVTGSVPTMSKKYEGMTFEMPDKGTLEKTGFLFRGWNDGSATYLAGETYTMPGNDVTFNAVWESKADSKWHLVTNEAMLTDGSKIIIAAADYDKALSEIQDKKDYCDAIDVEKQIDIDHHNDNKLIYETEPIIFTLVKNADGSFALKNGENYLSVKETSSNMTYSASINNLSSWTITITADKTTIQSKKENSTIYMQYNSDAPRFNGYTGTQKAIAIYKYIDGNKAVREVSAETYTTFCIPQGVEVGNFYGATFWNIADKTFMTSDQRLYSITIEQEEGNLGAGVPYIMLPDAETTEFVYYATGEEKEAGTNNGLVGVFEKTMFGSVADDAAAIERGIYIISDGTLYLCGNNCGVYGNRAYIQRDQINSMPLSGAPRRTIGRPNDTPTTLNGLFGNQAGKAQKALIDGHIYILRDNKMYNAQGLFVK